MSTRQKMLMVIATMGFVSGCTNITETIKMAEPVKETRQVKIEKKIEYLLKQMTLEEKVYLWRGCSRFEVGGIARLGIPKVKMTDGPQGVRGPTSTYFPTGISMAACWNEELMEKVGAALGRETRAAGCGVLLGPGVNIMRTPLGGRNFEYFGEDPLLAGKTAAAYVRGIQSENVAACVKHIVGNNQEWCRTTGNSVIGERALREIYLPAFKIACLEGNTWSIMSAYNRVNGTFASANKYIQEDIPKGEWDWNGAMISDWGGAHDWKGCATGGLDIIMPGSKKKFADSLIAAVKKGEVDEKIVTEHARRTLRLIYRTQGEIKGKEANTAEHQALGKELALESITLLKNDGILPFNISSLKSIAVIGPNAHKQHSMDGVRGSGGSGAVNPPYEITPLAGLKALLGDKVQINYVEDYSFGMGIEAAKKSEVVVVFAGINHTYDREALGWGKVPNSDRPDLELIGPQAELIKAVSKVNPNTVVVLIGSGPLSVEQWHEQVKGIAMAWYPGQDGGHAIAEILFGKGNPSGKLCCTWGKKLNDWACHSNGNYPGIVNGSVQYDEGIWVGYRHFEKQGIVPRFPFGHGLSYTTFKIEGLDVAVVNSSVKSPKVLIKLKVTNTGDREGGEVVQLYVSDSISSVERPEKELKAFCKVFLKPRESKTVVMELDIRSFAFWSEKEKEWKVEPGQFEILVGNSSRNIHYNKTIKLR